MSLTAENLAALVAAAQSYRREHLDDLPEPQWTAIYVAEQAARRILESLNIEVETAA